jgi:hypothetical protein
MKRITVWLAMLLAAWAGQAVSTRGADKTGPGTTSLSRALHEQMPAVMKYLRKMGYDNVGVLKFRIERNGKPSDNVGTLNSTLAARVETALLLETDEQKPVGIIRDASAVAAAHVPGANHLTEEGRDKLFAYDQYPLRWGKQRVRADAFVTGLVSMPDPRKLHVVLCVFDRKGEAEAFEFDADQDATTLIESGRSFLRLRGAGSSDAFLGGPDQDAKPVAARENEAVNAVVAQQDGKAKNPILDDKSPIVLEVSYDGVKQTPVPGEGGSVSIPEPTKGQEIRFRLIRRNDAPDKVYGAVLKINGESTLKKQTQQNIDCLRWILDAEQPSVTIDGYYDPDTKSRLPFKVLSRAESGPQEINYGKQVGQISLVVFRAQLANPPPSKDLPDGQDPAIARLKKQREDAIEASASGPSLPEAPPSITEAKRKALAEVTNGKKSKPPALKGLVVADGKAEFAEVTKVPFEPDPVPVQTVILTYYKRSKP